ncbi:sugar phosphate isomerase/epimerase [Parabacteroides sp. PF5-9]|uniref:sugar phosphate isomerase/epimerase family protein n=1 Tax=Parabacteroides sp. PF5-9 TaxID=1742404 RepID=UPI002473DE08|nr:sugar phosphate isomerase/epimerase [Parabacteroides sp. PF5-9]MDH6356278.1 sugar phosphate isomerase/epimerase [Parabacteroides sp. PF5-9]
MKNHTKDGQSRRQFLGRSAAALAAASVIPLNFACSGNGAATAGASAENTPVDPSKPNSKFNGVQIGTITYSWRSMPSGLENVIKYCKESNISSIELMSSDLEAYMGAPENPMRRMMRPPAAPPAQPQGAPGGQAPAAPAPRPGRQPLTPEQQAEVDKYNAELKNWRINLPMSKVEEARKLLNDNGIQAHIVKFSPARWSDEEIDYAFRAAKAMGAKCVTEEISLEAAQRLAPFAEKHDMYVGMHNHMQYAEEGFSADPILAVSPAVMLNFDTGHFYGSTGIHPNEMLKKYHDRIYSIHIKDKTGPTADPANTNQVWGQGEMPLADVLLLIKQEKWPIYCDIELEYSIAPWSNAVKEVGTCVKHARQILI